MVSMCRPRRGSVLGSMEISPDLSIWCSSHFPTSQVSPGQEGSKAGLAVSMFFNIKIFWFVRPLVVLLEAGEGTNIYPLKLIHNEYLT